jgi:hypothetical protein
MGNRTNRHARVKPFRFKKIDQLPLVLVGKAIASTSVDEFIELYEKTRNSPREEDWAS